MKNSQSFQKIQLNLFILQEKAVIYIGKLHYLYGHINEYNSIRQKVYNEAELYKKNVQPIFILDNTDYTILNIKLENQIEKIKENYFYWGMIEMFIFSNYYDLNDSLYISDNNGLDNYIYYTNISKDNIINNNMILHYGNRIKHFSILQCLNAPNKNIKNQIITTNTTNNFQLIFKDDKDVILAIKNAYKLKLLKY